MTVEVRDDRFRSVVGDGVEFEELGSGFDFTEGPIWHPHDNFLIFSDMPGNHMRRWSAAEGITTFRQPSNMANGNAWDREGRIVTCEHATSAVSRTEADGSISVLATHYGDKELNSPNDIIVKRDGAIYFSDPTYGRNEYYGVPREQDLDFQGVYRIAQQSQNLHQALMLLADDFAQPNGLCFSADESRLFVNDTERMHIRVFDVGADGSISNSRLWAETTGEGDGGPDGLKIDSAENVYCSGPGGVHVFDRDANCLGVIRTPAVTANFTWGDDDMCSLFLACSTALYRVRVKVPGLAAGF
jgi:gluconolactonase